MNTTPTRGSNNPGASTLPGMTINFENPNIPDREDEIAKEKQEEDDKIRQLLEAELNDDDLLDETESEENSEDLSTDNTHSQADGDFQQEHGMAVNNQVYEQQNHQYQNNNFVPGHFPAIAEESASHNLPGYSEKISNESAQTQIPVDTRNDNDQLHNVSYQQLLDFYRQRELELEKLEELISNNRQDHQRSLRAEQHKISMLENEVTDFKNEIDHKTNQINYKDQEILKLSKTVNDLEIEFKNSQSLCAELKDKVGDYSQQIQQLQEELSEAMSSDANKLMELKINYENRLEEQRKRLEDEGRDQRYWLGFGIDGKGIFQ